MKNLELNLVMVLEHILLLLRELMIKVLPYIVMIMEQYIEAILDTLLSRL